MRKLLLLLVLLIPYEVQAQTPQVLRVNIDATGALVAIGSAQTLPLTSCLFSNCRLAVDASGNLKIVLVGGTVTSPIFAPTQSSCSTVSYSFTGRTTTGLNSHAADTWNLCGGGTLGLSGNTTDVTSSLPLTITEGTITTDRPIFNGTTTWNAAGVAFNGIKYVITDTASAAGSLAVSIKGGASGTTNLFSLDKTGILTAGSTIIGTNIQAGSTGYIAWLSRSLLRSPSDGIITLANAAETDFSRLQFGGTTSSFPSLKRVSNQIQVRLADDSDYADLTARNLDINTAGSYYVTNVIITATAPTIASGGCTSPAVTWNNGTAAFLITIGTSCTGVKTFTLTMPAATNGWSCRGDNHTSDAAQQTNYIVARSTSTTAVVVTSYDRTTNVQEDFTASNTYLMSCMGG